MFAALVRDAIVGSLLGQRQAPRLRLSQLGDHCSRRVYYEATGASAAEEEERHLIKMAVGTGFDRVALPQQMYLGNGIMLHSQVTVAIRIGRLAVEGHADLVFYRVVPTDDGWFNLEPLCVYDLKTVGEYRMVDGERKRGTWERIQKRPDERHEAQVNGYAYATGAPLRGVVYANANTGELLVHPPEPTDAFAARADFGVLEEADRHTRLGEPPDRPYEDHEEDDGTVTLAAEKWPCAYCKFREPCWPREEDVR